MSALNLPTVTPLRHRIARDVRLLVGAGVQVDEEASLLIADQAIDIVIARMQMASDRGSILTGIALRTAARWLDRERLKGVRLQVRP